MGIVKQRASGQLPRIGGRLEYVDFARGFAIIAIVLSHYLRRLNLTPWLSSSIDLGGSAVHLFFFLSGFCLTLSYSTYDSSFYTRRFLGILLPYYLFVTLVFLIAWVLPVYPAGGWLTYLSHILLFKMFDNELIASYGGHLWFVSTIIEFYAVFPLLFVCLKKGGKWAFSVAALCLSAAYWIVLYRYDLDSGYIYKDFFLRFLWEFALGMVYADLVRQRGFGLWETRMSTVFATFIVSVSGLLFLHLQAGTFARIFNDIPLSLIFFSVSIMSYRFLRNCVPVIVQIMFWIGHISYSLYLVHMLCLALVIYFLKAQTVRGVDIIAAITIALVSAHIFYAGTERLQRFLKSNISFSPLNSFRSDAST